MWVTEIGAAEDKKELNELGGMPVVTMDGGQWVAASAAAGGG
jgi:hypothetical protein